MLRSVRMSVLPVCPVPLAQSGAFKGYGHYKTLAGNPTLEVDLLISVAAVYGQRGCCRNGRRDITFRRDRAISCLLCRIVHTLETFE